MRVIICVAGIAGLALANRLAAMDWEVVVVERTPGPRTQGYMIDFFGPGVRRDRGDGAASGARAGRVPRH